MTKIITESLQHLSTLPRLCNLEQNLRPKLELGIRPLAKAVPKNFFPVQDPMYANQINNGTES